jgi:peptide/nickel transport system ATP-binding protein
MVETTNAPVLDLKGLTVRLPRGSDRANAVENITLAVGAGEIVCVVGESGSGKSVTAQAVMGLLPRELEIGGGQALLQGEDVLQASPSHLRDLRGTRMAMIFQEPMTALNPVMKVGDQIAEVLEIHTRLSEPDRRQRVLQIMRLVHLPEPERLIDVYPHQLSGGQRQRIMIAAARRDDPGADPAPHPRAAGEARHRRAVHHS